MLGSENASHAQSRVQKSLSKRSAVSRRSVVDKKKSERCIPCAITRTENLSKRSAVSQRSVVDKKERKVSPVRDHAYRKSVQTVSRKPTLGGR